MICPTCDGTESSGVTVAAFSGGKDSTAMVLEMARLGEDFVCLFTPTGNELPAVAAHISDVIAKIDRELVLPPAQPLSYWIEEYNALPNFRQRWCTRLIKIKPCILWLQEHPRSTLCVGLRADEEARKGLYGPYATYRYPLREWGWGVADVVDYCRCADVNVPPRTDCAVCYDQRLSEWYSLWRNHPGEYARGERWEEQTGHTFRSPARDTWPAAMSELRARFEQGRKPRGVDDQLAMFEPACRVCRL